jgi:sec-independent protein translocase protein TatB
VLSLSPLKLVIVLIVALVLVGPDKLPGLARQMGAAWKAFRGFSTRIEDEVRANMPDLPSTGDIARFARSPVALLDSLAKLDDEPLVPDPGVDEVPDDSDHLQPDPGAPHQGDADVVGESPDSSPSPATTPPRTTSTSSSSSSSTTSSRPTSPSTDTPIDPSLN